MKTKTQKQSERRKKIEKERNLRQNQRKVRYILFIREDGNWKSMMRFYNMEEVNSHVENMEDLRKRNAAEIIEAIIVESKTNNIIRKIEAHQMKDPALRLKG